MNITMSILLATDGSPEALTAAEWLDRWAQPDRATITLATVMAIPTGNWELGVGSYVSDSETYQQTMQDMIDKAKDHANQLLQRTREQFTNCAPFREEILAGMPAAAIVDYAKKHHIDLIVMGRRGHSALGNLMGSVSFGVLQRSPIPVTIIS